VSECCLWKFGLRSVLGILLGTALLECPAIAQLEIIPDTAPGRNLGTQVQRNGVLDLVTGGTRPQNGANLFHSFQEFNVQEGRGVYFASPEGVQNILSRVTGSDRSDILGTLGTFRSSDNSIRVPGVNLFLINPNGFLFGRNASLDIGGSLFVTTANAIRLGETGLFSASQSESINLLSINPSAFLFSAVNSQVGIEVQSRATRTVLGNITTGLEVPSSQTLVLLGGTVNIAGGQLIARGGRLEVGGVMGNDAVGLNDTNQLIFPANLNRANVTFANNAAVDVRLNDSGVITITANNLTIRESNLIAGIFNGLGSPRSQAGNVTLDATGEIRLEKAGIANFILPNAQGNGGNVNIKSDALVMTGGSQLVASTLGNGNAGNVVVEVSNAVILSGESADGQSSSSILSRVERGAAGRGGNVQVKAGSLYLGNGAQLATSTLGKGDAGNIVIDVRDDITLTGRSANERFPSSVLSNVDTSLEGNGGNVKITAGSIQIRNGAQISVGNRGSAKGNSGNVVVEARDGVIIGGTSISGQYRSGISSSVGTGNEGKGGNLQIEANSFRLDGGAVLSASTNGKGDSGNIMLIVRDTATLDGVSNSGFRSRIENEVGQTGTGKGGNLNITAGSLSVTNGAGLSSSTLGQGNAGDITLIVRDAAIFDGASSNGFESGAASAVGQTGTGKGGNLVVIAGSLNLKNSVLSSSTFGRGEAGNIEIRLQRDLQISNSQISTLSLATNGGAVDILARSIYLLDKSNIATFVFSGAGTGGKISLTANSIIALDDSNILAFARSGKGGDIQLNTRAFFGQNYRPVSPGTDPAILVGNGQVDVNASGGTPGIITLPDTTFLQNDLSQLPQDAIDTNVLLANSCIARTTRSNSTFYKTGAGGLPTRPEDAPLSAYSTGEIRSTNTASRPWKKGDEIAEPQGVYQLPNGKLVLSRECPNE
jgi:filamentous hemagglutinin family protein